MKLTPNSIQFLNPDDLMRRGELTPRLKGLAEGDIIVLSDSETAPHIAKESLLKLRPDYRKGRERSLHEVWFADMNILGTGNNEANLLRQPIAIKPSLNQGDEWLVSREFRLANKLNANEKVTFEPYGFIRNNKKIGMITKFEEGVTTFDNIISPEKSPTQSEIHWALSCAAETLIYLHAKGLSHGDFQAKNTAYDSNLKPRIVDITTIKNISDPLEATDDLEFYIESLSDFGRQSTSISSEQVSSFFLEPYIESIDYVHPVRSKGRIKKATSNIARDLPNLLKQP